MKPKTILVLIALFFALTMQAAGKAWCFVTDKGEVVELLRALQECQYK